MNKNKGFTLIELLVVIAIIGVLTSVVLMVLNSAKVKGVDNSIKSGLNQARIQADLYYLTNGSYLRIAGGNVCSVSADNSNPKGINGMVYIAGKSNNYTTSVNVNGAGTSPVRCNVSTDGSGWAAEIPLKGVVDSYYCVDYTRKGIVTTTSIGGTNAFCQ